MHEPVDYLTVPAAATVISTSAFSSMKVSESLLSASMEQIVNGAFVVQLSDLTGITAFTILIVKVSIDIIKYVINKKNSVKN